MATGSADGSIAFWKWARDEHDTEHRIKSLSDFSHWVVKIILRSSSQHSITSLDDSNLLFSMTRDNITLHSWKAESANATVIICDYWSLTYPLNHFHAQPNYIPVLFIFMNFREKRIQQNTTQT